MVFRETDLNGEKKKEFSFLMKLRRNHLKISKQTQKDI